MARVSRCSWTEIRRASTSLIRQPGGRRLLKAPRYGHGKHGRSRVRRCNSQSPGEYRESGPSPGGFLEGSPNKMRRILVSFLTVAFALPGQKIDTETPARDRVVRVQTALNHLTVIEVAEPVTTVAVGSPQAFKVERRENKVFIQPLQDGTATNLFIWTATTRLNYELVPAVSDAAQMDFAIDYRQPQPQAQVTKPKPPEPVAVVSTVPSE